MNGPLSMSAPRPGYPAQVLGLGILTGNEVSSAVASAAAAPKAGGAGGGSKSSKGPRSKKDDEASYTTIMLRNIPNKYTRQMLMDQLHNIGFRGDIDYLYLPIDFANRCNVGYCFINFRTPAARARFVEMFDGVAAQSCLPGFNSYKVCQVTKAKWQGRDENVRRIRSGPELMQQLAGHPDWLPVLLDESGRQETFVIDDVIQAGNKAQSAQKGRNAKKQILIPGALRPGSAQMPGLSDLLDGNAQAASGGRGKKASAKSQAQPGAKGKAAPKKAAKAGAADASAAGAAMGIAPLAALQLQQQMAAMAAAAGGCGMTMPMSPGFAMQAFPFMQPGLSGYEGLDASSYGMMPYAGMGADMQQYGAGMFPAAWNGYSSDGFDFSQADPRFMSGFGAQDEEDDDEEDDGDEEEEDGDEQAYAQTAFMGMPQF
eukprot:TRINITY_DN65061_c0_g1_i1.p1 TRINITY_DN65061_c0_g1~~TRINITY_DN65061_c0_g1_i1.p1  ORF type:complete len:429 (+),score=118.35 TRINITY_DN65061_c0_g1_i1:86-1372(+)